MITKNYKRAVFVSVVLCSLLVPVGWVAAECTRSDVQYFLNKGFSHEQIVALCGQAKQPVDANKNSGYQAYNEELEARLRLEKRLQQEEDDVFLLKAGIAGENIKLSDDWIDYQRPLCLTAGNSYDVESRLKVCPNVRFRVYFKGLDIKGYSRKYLAFGAREIEVVGTVKRKLLHDFKEYDHETRRLLFASYKALTRPDGTSIPVRKDYSVSQIQEILRGYVARANQASAE